MFNSYDVAAGARYPRPQRGLLTRPTVEEVGLYRHRVTEATAELLDAADGERREQIGRLVDIGIKHEKQHQELLLMDVLHLFSHTPLRPAFAPLPPVSSAPATPPRRVAPDGGERQR